MVAKINRIIKTVKIRQVLTICRIYALCLIFCFLSFDAGAISFISDDESETLVNNIVKPIFKTAGISFNPNKVLIANDNTLNAFVSDGNYLVIHTGTLLNADNVNELSGILAHEAGHIAGGHIVRQKIRIGQAQTASVASLIAAGAAAAASGNAEAAIAVMLGSQSSLLNSMTAYQMQEERSADESAIKYLKQLNQSPAGLKTFMQKSDRTNRLNGYGDFPYFRTHPLNSERIAFFTQASEKSTGTTKSPLDNSFNMVKAKLSAFLLPVKQGLKLYPLSDTSAPAQYAHAILYYRQNKLQQSLKSLNALIAAQPDNPFFYELKGQFLFEKGHISEAISAYRQALTLRPDSAEIMFGWAQAALEAPHDAAELNQIIAALNRSVLKKNKADTWILLARAYDEANRKADALYASARFNLLLENYNIAEQQIKQAEKNNPSPELKLKLNDLKAAINSSRQ